MNTASATQSAARRRRIALAVGMEGMGSLLPMVLKALAAEEPADIEGTFVEDQNLLNLAALPVFKEVCRVSREATSRQRDISQQLKLRAEATRAALLSAAEGAGARWSFHIAQGTICAEARRSAEAADFVAIAASRRTVTRSTDMRLYAEEWMSVPLRTRRKVTQEAHLPIALYIHSGDIQQRALSTAASIARRFGRPLLVLTERPTVDLNTAIVNRVHQTVRPRLLGIPGTTPAQLAAAVRQAQAALLVAPALEAFLADDAIRHFHEESNAPTLLVQEEARTVPKD